MDLFGEEKTIEEKNAENLNLIPGLAVIYNFINRQEEVSLLRNIDSSIWLDDLSRKVQHYGYKYDYKSRNIKIDHKIGDLPEWLNPIMEKFKSVDALEFEPDQAIINDYEPGQGIARHIDCEPCFGDAIMSLSLNSDIVMDFKQKSANDLIPIFVPARSLIILRGVSRYDYLHGIALRKTDVFDGKKHLRKRRVSITFRKVILNQV